jgi:hypothetical protein
LALGEAVVTDSELLEYALDYTGWFDRETTRLLREQDRENAELWLDEAREGAKELLAKLLKVDKQKLSSEDAKCLDIAIACFEALCGALTYQTKH